MAQVLEALPTGLSIASGDTHTGHPSGRHVAIIGFGLARLRWQPADACEVYRSRNGWIKAAACRCLRGVLNKKRG